MGQERRSGATEAGPHQASGAWQAVWALSSMPQEPSKLENGVSCGQTFPLALVEDGLLAPEEERADGSGGCAAHRP